MWALALRFAVLSAALIPAAFVPKAAAAAPSQEEVAAFRALAALDKRLVTTGYRLAKANVRFCNFQSRHPGLMLHDLAQYSDQAGAAAAFTFPAPVTISAVVDDGPAARAGLLAGDGLTGLDGKPFDWERIAKLDKGHERRDAVLRMLASQLSLSDQMTGMALRGEMQFSYRLSAPLVCAAQFEVSTGQGHDAGSDGNVVRVSSSLIEFASGEDELAFVVAHELSHNLLEHQLRLDRQKVKRGIGRMFGKSKRLIRQTEVEADSLAIWLMQNAGYRTDAAVTFIERLDKKRGPGLFSDGTHYRWKKRAKLMQQEIATIAQSSRTADGYAPPLLIAHNSTRN